MKEKIIKKENKKLTKRQKQIVDYIREITKKRGYAPSIREICFYLGLHSDSTVHNHLCNLEKKGYIKREAGKSRAITLIKEKKASRNIYQKEMLTIINHPLLLQVSKNRIMRNLSQIISELDDEEIMAFYVQGDFLSKFGIQNEYIILVKGETSFKKDDLVFIPVADKEIITGYYQDRNKTHYNIKLKDGTLISTSSRNFIAKVIDILIMEV
jgi:repressor LexA